MTKQEARRIAYAVICMVIQDSNAYDLISHWAKDETEVEQLREALTEVRDLLEQRAGMAEEDAGTVVIADGPRDQLLAELKAASIFDDDEPITETESK